MTSASHVAVAPAPELQPLDRDVLLRDGATLRLQAPTPADLDDIKAFYDGLSPAHGRTDGDVLVGAVSDPDLGPVLGVGFGPRRAGLGRTAAFRLLPVTDAEADELIDSAEGVATELDGFRGRAALDRQALRELMLRFALLLREVPEVVETDLNPVRWMTSGCVVLDMRLRVERRCPIKRVQTW